MEADLPSALCRQINHMNRRRKVKGQQYIQEPTGERLPR
jgi:hypothetical protein